MSYSTSAAIRPAQFSVRFILYSFLQATGLPFADLLPAEEIEAALGSDNDEPRDDDGRIYTPHLTLWAFLTQMLFKGEQRSCRAAVSRVVSTLVALGLRAPSDATGTYCRARARLPEEGIARITRQVADAAEDQVPDDWRLHGRRVFLIDGSTSSMPDTEANQEEYPQQGAQKAGVGFPIFRYVVLVSMATAMVHDVAIGKYAGKETGEPALFRQLLGRLRAGDIVVADRYYCSYFMIALLQAMGVDVVMRQHHRRDTNFRRGKRLGRRDHVATWTRPERPEWMDQETYDRMPLTLTIRELEVHVDQQGFRTESLVVTTTLTDADTYSRDDLARMYRSRWLVELDIRTIKCTMDLDVLRCQSPEMVRKELWTGLLAYNLIRRMILQACSGSERTPREVSFTAAMQKVASCLMTVLLCQGPQREELIARHLSDLVGDRIGNRPDRVEPRLVKRRPKPHKLLQEPRAEARRKLGPDGGGNSTPYGPSEIAAADNALQTALAEEA